MAYDHKAIEQKWNKNWQDNGTYLYDETASRDNSFVVDTPPPTVSGSLHIGHVFSYTQTDIQVRYNRMLGKNIFYPIGWDDNGLPTERRVQNYYAIKCDSNVPYVEGWKPFHDDTKKDQGPQKEVSRENFIEACNLLAGNDEKVFEDLFKSVGHSYDWRYKYATIDDNSRRTSQLSFLDLVKKGVVYNREMPGMWDITFNSAIAQAEVEDREMASKFYDLEFKVEDGTPFVISTTRPEFVAACIAVVAHPDDKHYQHLFGKTAITPGFYAPVPICPSEHAVPDKGTGIMMVCTFGDIQDVEWWKKSGLPMKQIISKQGKILDVDYGKGAFACVDPEKGCANYAKLVGLSIPAARKQTIEILEAEGAVKGFKDIVHDVKFYEKGDYPIEFVPSRQWFIDILNHKEEFLAQGRKIQWHPAYMLSRYEHWVEGLNQDWCISRQRFFGVPFPVWYKLDAKGNPDYENPLYADESQLPVDPMITAPKGYREDQRGQPNGFIGEPDVMDTWATSSLTPQLSSHWGIDNKRHKALFPADLRPQSHDIIRTWAFYTIVKAWFHEQEIPWKHIAVSGFIVDPDRKKMSKSKGNVVTPENLIVEYSADAVRYWAGKAKLGADTIYDPSLFTIGKKLVTKIFNAGNFVKTILDRAGAEASALQVSDITEAADIAMLEQIAKVIERSTKAFEDYDYSSALQNTEDLFWKFCDYYIELVKSRAYGEEDTAERRSALAGLLYSFRSFLLLFAPFMPYVTEEMWSVFYPGAGSVHRTAWPRVADFESVLKNNQLEDAINVMIEILSEVRGAKSQAQKNMRWPLETLKIAGREANLKKARAMIKDIAAASSIAAEKIELVEEKNVEGKSFNIEIVLGEAA